MRRAEVMSSCLGKKPEGAISPFRFFVEAVEDRVQDAIDAGHVDEAHHGSRTPANFHEAPLDDIGVAHFGLASVAGGE